MLEGTTGQPSVHPEKLDPSILKNVQNKLIKQDRKKIIALFFFSKPEFLVAIATKEKLYGRYYNSRIRLMKLILLIKGNK